mgnify:FL=1|jgi:hypothetical protein
MKKENTHKIFNRRQIKGTHRRINDAMNKYEKMIIRQDLSTDDDCVKTEMADEFLKELRGIRESFLNER